MKQLLNTLYVLTDGAYLTLDGENVVVKKGTQTLGRVPLHTLESISSFSYAGASPALMGACASNGIALSFYDMNNRFLAGVTGPVRGNVLLRRRQIQWSDDEMHKLCVAKSFIVGKLFNSRWVLERALRDHSLRVEQQMIRLSSERIRDAIKSARKCDCLETLRGIEGNAASEYFSVFNELILREKDMFIFPGRNRRPPTDPINAMLSLFYVVLERDCTAALEGVGLDPYVGFMHTIRPGRRSLSLDLMEELRAVVVDRFVLSAINNRVVAKQDFMWRETGEVRLTEEARKKLFQKWQDRKRETLVHPYLHEKIFWGLVPHVQAQLLAKCIREDIDGYPCFLWK